MRRLSRAAALTAVSGAMALAAFGCKKEEAKTADAPADPKAAPASPSDPAAPPAAGGESTAPAEPGGATGAMPPPGMGKPPEPMARPASVNEKQIAIADKIVDATNKFAADLGAAGGDCKKATGVVKSGGGAVKLAMADTDKLQAELNNDQPAMMWFQQTYGPKMMTAIQKLGAVVNQCREDKDFEVAFKALGMGGPSSRPPPPPAGHAPGAAPAEPPK